MVKDFPGAKKDSNVVRFITSGKPGFCFLSGERVEKLEAHHVSYKPEITCNLSHKMHHTAHFWPLRLTDEQRLKLLRLRFDEKKAWQLLDKTRNDAQALARLIAPSRSKFIHAQQIKEIKRIKPVRPKK